MKKLIEHITNKDFNSADGILEETFKAILEKKMCEMKKRLAAEMYSSKPNQLPSVNRLYRGLTEENLEEARVGIVKARIRGGKVQRRVKVSNVPGMKISDGKLVRMSPAERRARKLGAKRAKIKTRGKQAQIARKRKLSLRKRERLGI